MFTAKKYKTRKINYYINYCKVLKKYNIKDKLIHTSKKLGTEEKFKLIKKYGLLKKNNI